VLVLCRQCIRYIYEGTTVCPHCGRDSREISDRYREGGYLAIETIQRVARAAERRCG
jgi:RNA polymerase subunit RPABC4/transcription elongation factor Spt4